MFKADFQNLQPLTPDKVEYLPYSSEQRFARNVFRDIPNLGWSVAVFHEPGELVGRVWNKKYKKYIYESTRPDFLCTVAIPQPETSTSLTYNFFFEVSKTYTYNQWNWDKTRQLRIAQSQPSGFRSTLFMGQDLNAFDNRQITFGVIVDRLLSAHDNVTIFAQLDPHNQSHGHSSVSSQRRRTDNVPNRASRFRTSFR